MPSGRAMFENGPTGLTTIETPQGPSLADMMHLGLQRQRMQQAEEQNQRNYELQQQKLVMDQQQAQHQLFKDMYNFSQNPQIAANPDVQDALFGTMGKMLGLPELTPESMRLSRDSMKNLFKAATTGDPNQSANALAEVATRLSPQDFDKVSGAFSQFNLVREKMDAVKVHRQVEEAKYNQLQDQTVKVEVGRKYYTPAAMVFRDALRGTETKEYQDVMGGVERILKNSSGPKGSSQAIQDLLIKSKFPQFSKEQSDQLADTYAQKREEFAAMADTSTKVLDDVNKGVSGLSFAGKAILNHRINIGLELSDAYSALEAFARDPFNRDKLRAAKQAGQTIEAQRQAMDKLQAKNDQTAVQLRQQAFDMATQKGLASDFAQKQFRLYQSQGLDENKAMLKAANDTEDKFPGVPYEADKLKVSKPLVQNTITQSQEKAESATVGTGFGKQYSALQDADLESRSKMAKYARMDQLLSTIQTGKLEPAKTTVQTIAESLGATVDKSLPAKQAFQALSGEIALTLRNPSGGAGMPGALSEKDLVFLQSMSPDLAKTNEGNKMIIDSAMKLAKRDQEVARLAREYRKKHGQFDEGFFDELAAYSEKNPLFTGGGSTTPSPNGAPYKQSGPLQPTIPSAERIATYGNRPDGTPKGAGYFGEIPNPSTPGEFSTELSIGVNIGGKPIDIPLLTPNLSRYEIESVMRGRDTKDIVNKAVEHAKQRMKQGKSPYADKGEIRQLPAWKPGEFDKFYNGLRSGDSYIDPNGTKRMKK